MNFRQDIFYVWFLKLFKDFYVISDKLSWFGLYFCFLTITYCSWQYFFHKIFAGFDMIHIQSGYVSQTRDH